MVEKKEEGYPEFARPGLDQLKKKNLEKMKDKRFQMDGQKIQRFQNQY